MNEEPTTEPKARALPPDHPFAEAQATYEHAIRELARQRDSYKHYCNQLNEELGAWVTGDALLVVPVEAAKEPGLRRAFAWRERLETALKKLNEAIHAAAFPPDAPRANGEEATK